MSQDHEGIGQATYPATTDRTEDDRRRTQATSGYPESDAAIGRAIRLRSAALQRRNLHWAAAVAVFAFAPIDLLAADAWSPTLLGIRLMWAVVLAIVGELLRRATSAAARTWLGFVTAATTPAFHAGIVIGCGRVGNPEYAWLAAMPIFSVMVSQELVWPAVLAALSSVGSTALAVAFRGGSSRLILSYTLLVAGAGALGVGAALVFRRRKAAERVAAAARRRTEALLADSQQRRTAAERFAMVGRLAAGVAHEINNPLAYVSANVRFLEQEWKAPSASSQEVEEVFRATLEGTSRMAQIVAHLSRLAEVEVGHGWCHVHQAMDEALRLVASRMASTRTQVVTAVEPGMPPVNVACRHLAEALANVLLNALDAAEENVANREPVVRIVAKSRDGGIGILVEDSGPGLSAPALAHLFEPFYTTKDPGRGSGLGLAVAREHLVRQGGTIDAENLAGGGARFTLWAPCSRDAEWASTTTPPAGRD